MKIYKENNIHGDLERVKLLKKELYSEIREGEKHLMMQHVADLYSRS